MIFAFGIAHIGTEQMATFVRFSSVMTLSGEGTTEEEAHIRDPFLTFADEDDSDGDDGFYRSRSKEDIFHQFQNLPIGKLEPLRSIV